MVVAAQTPPYLGLLQPWWQSPACPETDSSWDFIAVECHASNHLPPPRLQLTPTTPPEEGPWWASKWSFGTHSEQNGRKHMEDRLTACDVSDLAAFSAFKRAGFFAVFDG